jgi:hypothetical protein
VLVVGTLAGSLSFLTERADMFGETRQAAEGLLTASNAVPSGPQTILSVNFPGWIAPKKATFALGHEGVTFIPAYSSPIDLVWAMTGQERFIPNVVIEELQSHWRFDYQNYGQVWNLPKLQPALRGAGVVLFTSYRFDHLVTYDVGNLEYQNLPRPSTYVSDYNGQLALISGKWRRLDDALQVTLHWQSWLTLTQEVRTFVHLQDADGRMVAQEDGLPLMGTANPLWWKPGDQWRDMRVLVLPSGLKQGRYTLRVGVYPATGGDRFTALDPSGKRYQDDSAPIGTWDAP